MGAGRESPNLFLALCKQWITDAGCGMGVGSELPNLVLCKQWIADSRCGMGIGSELPNLILVLCKQWISDSRCGMGVAGELPNLFLVLYKQQTIHRETRYTVFRGLCTNDVLSKTTTIFAGCISVQGLYHSGYPPI